MNKRLLLFCLTIICTDQFLAGASSDLNNLAQALKTILEQEPPAKTSGQKKQPFATHLLLVMIDTSEEGDTPGKNDAMIGDLAKAFTCAIPILTTEVLVRALIRHENGNGKPLPANYHYFKVPGEKEPRMLFCLPEGQSLSEKTTGIQLGKLEEITTKLITDKTYELSNAYDVPSDQTGEMVKRALPRLFVPKKEYAPQDTPRWIILFNGHGSQYEPYDTETILKTKNFLQKAGTICGFDPDSAVEILSYLTKSLEAVLVDIGSCFGGGINMGYVLGKLGTTGNTTITTHTITGDSCTGTMTNFPEYTEYWQEMHYLNPHGQPDQIIRRLNQALINLMPDYLFIVLNIPCVKWPWNTTFSDTLGEKGYGSVIPINTKTVQQQGKRPLQAVHHQIEYVVYLNTIPFAIETGFLSVIHSGIPGSTFHTFEELSYPSSLIAPKASLSRCLFRTLKTETKNVTKLFHVKKLTCADGTYELRIVKKPTSYRALWVSQEGPEKFIEIRWDDENSGEAATEISREQATRWIKKFDKKIVLFKKIANAQAPYRRIENLGIETLPWDY